MIEVLDRESVIRAAVPSGQESLHDLARHQLAIAQPGKALGIEEPVSDAFQRPFLRLPLTEFWGSSSPVGTASGLAQSSGSWMSWKSFSTMWSAVTPSLSARKLVARRWRRTGVAT